MTFKQEANWAEAVVATDKCRVRVSHPAVVEVSAPFGEFFYEPLHALPGTGTKAIRTLSVEACPLLPLGNVAGVLYGVFVESLQVEVVGAAYGCDSYRIHLEVDFVNLAVVDKGDGLNARLLACVVEDVD